MKIPYIVKHMEKVPLNKVDRLYYDNETQLNYLDASHLFKAIKFIFGPETTVLTETNENGDTEAIFEDINSNNVTTSELNINTVNRLLLGPETTQFTKSVESTDADYYITGPDTTIRTYSIEPEDRDGELYVFGPDTTMQTRTLENSDIN